MCKINSEILVIDQIGYYSVNTRKLYEILTSVEIEKKNL